MPLLGEYFVFLQQNEWPPVKRVQEGLVWCFPIGNGTQRYNVGAAKSIPHLYTGKH